MLDRAKLVGTTCNLLLSCEAKREVVQTKFDPASLLKLVGSKIV